MKNVFKVNQKEDYITLTKNLLSIDCSIKIESGNIHLIGFEITRIKNETEFIENNVDPKLKPKRELSLLSTQNIQERL